MQIRQLCISIYVVIVVKNASFATQAFGTQRGVNSWVLTVAFGTYCKFPRLSTVSTIQLKIITLLS